ncbi:MAG TPA: hypothetical protein VI035_06460 [Solirubrobacterales bacterium]
MNRRLNRGALAGALSLVAAGVLTSSAAATYHENLIREVHETGDNGDYVVLQAFSAGQNHVSGRQVVTYDPGSGNPLSHVVLSNNVANGSNQATILVGDDTVPGADATDPGFNIDSNGGAVCFAEGTSITPAPTGIDCMAYGFGILALPDVPPASPYGMLFPLGGPNFDGKSIVRSTARGCPTLLEAVDDTNNSAADFAYDAPLARNNAAPITETACPGGNPTSPTNPGTTPAKKKCKKKKKHKRSAEAAKKKKCKKKRK